MTATVQIVERNTVNGTNTDKTSATIRFKSADNSTVDSLTPIVVPAAGSNWSYEKWMAINVTVAPSVQLTNIRWYTSGVNPFGAGVNMWWKTLGPFTTPALGTASTGYLSGFSYTAGASLVTGSGTYTGTGLQGNHLVMLLEVQSGAAQGAITPGTLTLSYDEI